MHKSLYLLVVALLCFSTVFATRSLNNHLRTSDLTRLQKVFIDGLASNDLQSIYYASSNIQPTNAAEKLQICKNLQVLHAESKLNEFEKNYYLIGAHKQLACAEKLPESLTKISAKSIEGSAQEIYYRIASMKLLGLQIDESGATKIVKLLQDQLKKEDSLTTLGYAFNAAAELPASSAAFLSARLAEIAAEADEVDGKMLQFEGGLSITALMVNGAFRVSKLLNKPLPISAAQAVKFANYFLSRRSVQTAKGAHVLIEALKTLNEADKISPICIQHVGNGQLLIESPTLNIAVVDLFGKAVKPLPQNIFARLVAKKGAAVLADKLQLISKSSDKTIFGADLKGLKPSRAAYTAEITIDNTFKQQLEFNVLGRVSLQTLEIAVVESDASTTASKHSLGFQKTLPETLNLDSTQKLQIKTVLLEEGSTKPINVHQAFLRFYNKATEQDIIYVIEQDSQKAYKFDADIGARAVDFGYNSDEYEIHLIIGDDTLSNSFQWHLCNVQLKFLNDAKPENKQAAHVPKPEIVHQFRVPDKRPARLVSDIFTGLCFTPLVLLFIFWHKLGINVSNFNLAPTTIGFHVGLGGMLSLFAFFWLQLNMFQTLRLLIPIAIFTFLCGNRLLRNIYQQRVSKSSSSSS